MPENSSGTRRILSLLANKWTGIVIRCLAKGEKRPSEMLILIEGISQKMLIQTLRQMERHGLATRKVHAVVPPRVDYLLTSLGRSLVVALEVLWHWAQKHDAEINAAQSQRERAVNPSVRRVAASGRRTEEPAGRARKLPRKRG